MANGVFSTFYGAFQVVSLIFRGTILLEVFFGGFWCIMVGSAKGSNNLSKPTALVRRAVSVEANAGSTLLPRQGDAFAWTFQVPSGASVGTWHAISSDTGTQHVSWDLFRRRF